MPVNLREPDFTELSIIDIRSLAWNASQGSTEARSILKDYHKKYAKLANSRLRNLRNAQLELSAYNRAVTYLSNEGKKNFSTVLPTDYKGMTREMTELITFLNSKTSKVAGARKALDEKLDSIQEYTGKTYTTEQRVQLGKLLGDDSISMLLREVRGDSAEVIDFLEEVAATDTQKEQLTSIIDKHLAGYQPWSSSPFFTNSAYLNYDQMMDELRRVSGVQTSSTLDRYADREEDNPFD